MFVEIAPVASHISKPLVRSGTSRLVRLSTLSVSQSRTDLDSHADTCVVGNNALVTHIHEVNGQPKFVNVVAYDPTLGSVRDM